MKTNWSILRASPGQQGQQTHKGASLEQLMPLKLDYSSKEEKELGLKGRDKHLLKAE